MSTRIAVKIALLMSAAGSLPVQAQDLRVEAVTDLIRPTAPIARPLTIDPSARIVRGIDPVFDSRAQRDSEPDKAVEPELHLDADDNPFPESASGKALHEHMVLMSTPAETLDESRERVAASLERLRADAAESADTLASTYERLDESEYVLRWTLMRMLADLETSESRELLVAVAGEKLPPERLEDTHYGSTQEQELMIRLRAVEGLSRLARTGDALAEKSLFALAREGESGTGVQLRAIKAYLSSGGDPNERAAYLARALPASLHDVLTTEVTGAEEFQARNEAFQSVQRDGSLLDPADAGEREDDKTEPPAIR